LTLEEHLPFSQDSFLWDAFPGSLTLRAIDARRSPGQLAGKNRPRAA